MNRRLVVATLPLALVLGACGPDVEEVAQRPPRDAAPSTSPADRPSETPAVPQARLDQRLRDAAWRNDVPRARSLLERGADVDAKDETEQSAYLIATSEGYLDLLRLTLRHGATVDDKDSWNGTGLIRAAERGHGLVVGELLRAGIDRDHVNRIGYQAIHEAVWLGEDTASYATTVRVLAAGGVQLDKVSPSAGLTPLQMARERGYDGLERILRKVTNRAEKPADANAALLRAARTGDADAVAVALRAGADIEARDDHERTALLLASTYDHVAVADVLVAMGADPDALDDRHDTPWLVTGVTGSVAMLEALLPANPDLTIKNRYGGLSPIPAGERGHVDYIRRVVKTDVDIDHVNGLGWTSMLEAVILGNGSEPYQEIIRILLDAGADPSIADRGGVTPLQHAEQRGYDEIADLLRR
ncbi:ankyrin repeat domain-containing protein [Nocardioides sp. QY071]|uniref:ankyrin repeat domain-containing protein n=1 Tax=Nocardioides sp. QY071 TaxID=3044187 RepID=UPI00249CA500|nr:ankyrin repeat domain-containing protein [Nocardioides sp. QY071]WGY02005.1 ankyrin repeat domain-containing protein [Nocardioides sp. QY071]